MAYEYRNLYVYNSIRRHLYMSKRKLTLSVEESLIKKIKHVCIEENTTISKLVEDYIIAINKNKNTIRAIKDMNK